MYLVSYDISNDKRRTKIAKEMENFGMRVQYSVFECSLSHARYTQMYDRLVKLMADDHEGSIRIYTICENCRQKIVTIGMAKQSLADEELLII